MLMLANININISINTIINNSTSIGISIVISEYDRYGLPAECSFCLGDYPAPINPQHKKRTLIYICQGIFGHSTPKNKT